MSVKITTTVRIETTDGEVLERTKVFDVGDDVRFVWHGTRDALAEMESELHGVVNAAFDDQIKMTRD